MGVILTHDLTDTVCGFLVGTVGGVAHLIHSKKHTAVNGLESVAHVRQGSRDDDRHRIVDIGALHLVLDIDLDNAIFFNHSFFNTEALNPKESSDGQQPL